MIDQKLINSNITHCLLALDQKKITIIEDVYQITDFFIKKILEYMSLNTKWSKVELQEKLNRTSITWDPDTVVEEVFVIFDNLTAYLNVQFNTNFKFNGLQFWKDLPGYQISKHVDNNRVGYAIQIYLTGGIELLGTHFYKDNNVVEIPYKVNFGYLTNSAQIISHGMINSVPENHTRYSIYGIWA